MAALATSEPCMVPASDRRPDTDPGTDFSLPTLDLRLLARRAALPAALVVIAIGAFIAAGGPMQAFANALRRAVAADPEWVAGAAVFEALSFVGYVGLLWLVGSRATHRMGLRESVHVTLGGAAATRLLPTAGAGGAALTLWAFRRSGLGGREAARTLMTFLVTLYSVFLTAILVSGGLIATGVVATHGPLALSAVPATGAAIGIAAPLVLFALSRRPRPERPATTRAARLRSGGMVMGEAVGDALRLVRTFDPRLAGALAWWTFDAAVLWAMLHAFGTPPAFAVVVLAYFVGQVGNTIPIPGAVSGGMVGVLLAFGVQADLALTSVLAYRAVAIWLPAPVGLAALGGLRRTMARWKAETAS